MKVTVERSLRTRMRFQGGGPPAALISSMELFRFSGFSTGGGGVFVRVASAVIGCPPRGPPGALPPAPGAGQLCQPQPPPRPPVLPVRGEGPLRVGHPPPALEDVVP